MNEQTKQCNECKEFKTFTDYQKDNRIKSGLRGQCNNCENIKRNARRHKTSKEERNRTYIKAIDNPKLWTILARAAKSRSNIERLPFDIDSIYIKSIWPKDNLCPITSKPLQSGVGKPCLSSPTLDRIIPELGYIKGNVRIISYIANACKRDISDPNFFRRIAIYIEENTGAIAKLSNMAPEESVDEYF